jgi:phosphoketolase
MQQIASPERLKGDGKRLPAMGHGSSLTGTRRARENPLKGNTQYRNLVLNIAMTDRRQTTLLVGREDVTSSGGTSFVPDRARRTRARKVGSTGFGPEMLDEFAIRGTIG